MKATVCIFAEPRRSETLKARLGPSVGEYRAAELSRALIHDCWQRVVGLPWARPILAASAEDAELPVDGGDVWLYRGTDRERRLTEVLARALGSAPAAIVISADAPGIPTEILDHAHTALGSSDVVLGPAIDGGFYLLGLRRRARCLLETLRLGAGEANKTLMRACRERELTMSWLEPWFAVTAHADLILLQELLAAGAIEAPVTAEVLGTTRAG